MQIRHIFLLYGRTKYAIKNHVVLIQNYQQDALGFTALSEFCGVMKKQIFPLTAAEDEAAGR